MAYKNISDLNLTRLCDYLFGRALRLADTEVPVTGTRVVTGVPFTGYIEYRLRISAPHWLTNHRFARFIGKNKERHVRYNSSKNLTRCSCNIKLYSLGIASSVCGTHVFRWVLHFTMTTVTPGRRVSLCHIGFKAWYIRDSFSG